MVECDVFVCSYHGCRGRVDRRCFSRRCRRMVRVSSSSLSPAHWTYSR